MRRAASSCAAQRKIEVREELRQGIRKVLATKEDLANLHAELKKDIATLRTGMGSLEARMDSKFAQLDKKFTVLWLVTLFVIVFLNQNALEFLARLLGLMK